MEHEKETGSLVEPAKETDNLFNRAMEFGEKTRNDPDAFSVDEWEKLWSDIKDAHSKLPNKSEVFPGESEFLNEFCGHFPDWLHSQIGERLDAIEELERDT